MVDFSRRLPALLLLLLLVVSAGGVSASRSIRTIKEEGYFRISHHVGVKKAAVKMERRMEIQVNDYPGTGANHNHDPTPPGRKG